MQLKDPRKDFVQRLNLAKSRVKFDLPIVLLCGGRYKNEGQQQNTYLSIRQGLIESCPSFPYEFLVAESHPQWIYDGIFPDLVSYENCLASICGDIVLILESASSLAESGVFAQCVDLRKKTILVIPRKYHKSESYIDLGVVRLINSNGNNTHFHDWNEHKPDSITDELIQEILGDIEDKISSKHKVENFSKGNIGHVLILAYQIISLHGALKQSEVFKILKDVGLNIEHSEIKRYLYVLENLQVIKVVPVGDNNFYTRTTKDFHTIGFEYDEGIFDPVRFESDCIEFYRANNSERKRVRAISFSLRGQFV